MATQHYSLDYNLKCNLLLIREAFRAFTKDSDTGMDVFYKALGIFPPANPKYDVDYTPETHSNYDQNDDRALPYLTPKGKPISHESAMKIANDIYTNALLKNTLNEVNYVKIVTALQFVGVKSKFLKRYHTARLFVNSKTYRYNIETHNKALEKIAKMNPNQITQKDINNIEYLQSHMMPVKCNIDNFIDIYLDDLSNKKDKTEALYFICNMIYSDFDNSKKCLANLFTIILKLISMVCPTIETDLTNAKEIMEKIIRTPISADTKDSYAYAEYINALAHSVNTVQNDFPEFYEVTQRINPNLSVESIMTDITINLELLRQQVITKNHAVSVTCANMLNSISNVMIQILNAK